MSQHLPIPKIIHYAWFGPNRKSDLINQCIESWHLMCPDWLFIEWNEENFPVDSHPYTALAFEQQRYAFISDYARADALFKMGGVWLDTDVELHESLDQFRQHDAFSGFEIRGLPFTAVWGAAKGHIWPQKVLERYDSLGTEKRLIINTILVTDLLVSEFEIDATEDRFQVGRSGVTIYPSSVFCVPFPKKVSTHHFEGSWVASSNKKNYSEFVYERFLLSEIDRLDINLLKIYASKFKVVAMLAKVFHRIIQILKNK